MGSKKAKNTNYITKTLNINYLLFYIVVKQWVFIVAERKKLMIFGNFFCLCELWSFHGYDVSSRVLLVFEAV
jgi:hypothetical protein